MSYFLIKKDFWYEFNDSRISKFNLANSKNEWFGGSDGSDASKENTNYGHSLIAGFMDEDYVTDGWGEKSRSAYMLFYERVEQIKL